MIAQRKSLIMEYQFVPEKGQKRLRLSDFENKSVAEFSAWIEEYLGIRRINVSRIWSVRVTSSIEKLLRSKRTLTEEMVNNITTLEVFANEEERTEKEKVVLRSMVSQWEYWRVVVEEQIGRLETASRYVQLTLDYEVIGGEDDAPY